MCCRSIRVFSCVYVRVSLCVHVSCFVSSPYLVHGLVPSVNVDFVSVHRFVHNEIAASRSGWAFIPVAPNPESECKIPKGSEWMSCLLRPPGFETHLLVQKLLAFLATKTCSKLEVEDLTHNHEEGVPCQVLVSPCVLSKRGSIPPLRCSFFGLVDGRGRNAAHPHKSARSNRRALASFRRGTLRATKAGLVLREL